MKERKYIMFYSKKAMLIDGLVIFFTGIIISNLGINNIFLEILCLSVVLVLIDALRLKIKKSRKEKNNKPLD